MSNSNNNNSNNNNNNNNVYLGSSGSSNRLLTSLRDGSTELYPSALATEYDAGGLQSYYSPSRMGSLPPQAGFSASRSHKKSSSAGSFNNDFPADKLVLSSNAAEYLPPPSQQVLYGGSVYSRTTPTKETSHLMSAMSLEMGGGGGGGDAFPGMGSHSLSRLSVLNDISNTSGSSLLHHVDTSFDSDRNQNIFGGSMFHPAPATPYLRSFQPSPIGGNAGGGGGGGDLQSNAPFNMNILGSPSRNSTPGLAGLGSSKLLHEGVGQQQMQATLGLGPGGGDGSLIDFDLDRFLTSRLGQF
jgi:hypothetical protein